MQDPFTASFQSFDSLFRRLFVFDPAANPQPLFAAAGIQRIGEPIVKALIAAVTLTTLVKLARDGGAASVAPSIGILGLTTLLLAPATATYHFVLLWLPVGLLIDYCLRQRRDACACILLGCYALIGFFPYRYTAPFEGRGGLTLIAYPRLLLLSAMFITCLYFVWEPSAPLDPPTHGGGRMNGNDVGRHLSDTRIAFDSVAADYDGPRGNNSLIQDMRTETWAWFDRTFAPGSRLIDLGCGTGLDAVRMARLGHRVLATDWSPQMIARTIDRARRESVADRVQARSVGAHELDLLDEANSLDGAYSNLGPLNCVPDLLAVSKACARLLKPGGALVFTVIGRWCSLGDRSLRGARALVACRDTLRPGCRARRHEPTHDLDALLLPAAVLPRIRARFRPRALSWTLHLCAAAVSCRCP